MGLFSLFKKKPQKSSPAKPVEVREDSQAVKRSEAIENSKGSDQTVARTNSKNKYHVSQNKDDSSPNFKQWRVRKEGSDKTIKYYPTQKQAIEDAESRAEKSGGSIVIHKVDGSIRKQKY